jgi:hypothetical protein
MADARVDKSWQSKGLASYPVEAIFGTLKHYGVDTSAAAFAQLASQKFPLAIGELWLKSWRGTGQFSSFPAAAANELWKRLALDRLAPAQWAEALEALMAALARMLEGAPDAPVGKSFAQLDELRPKVPTEAGVTRRDFALEVAAHLGKGFETFNHLSAALAQDGQLEDAQAFAQIEAFLFPERAGVAQAVVQAASGARDEAVAQLAQLAADAGRGGEGRLAAVDALLALDAFDAGEPAARSLLDALEAAKDYHLAFDALQRLGYALEKLGKGEELEQLESRASTLAEAHRAAHPDH